MNRVIPVSLLSRLRGFAPRLFVFVVVLLLSLSVRAADGSTGILAGRISSASDGNSLANAIVRVEGTDIQTVTNDLGEYRLAGLPAGQALHVDISFAGMISQTETVEVQPGQVATHDVAMVLSGTSVVALEKYTVSARELTGQAIADEEKKTAPNIKDVISIDTFGDMGEGNIGEFIKYIPGIALGYNPQTPQYASVRGMPSSGTIMELNGQQVATAQNSTRSFDLGIMAAGNVDRVEVSKEPTPDMPANAVGGMINVITKNGFSVGKPTVSYNAFLTASGLNGGGMSDVNWSLRSATPDDPLTKGAPNRVAYNLSLLLPITKKLAFTAAVSQSDRPSSIKYYYSQWDQVKDVETYNRVEYVGFNEKRDLGQVGLTWRTSDLSTLDLSFQATDSDNYVRLLEVNALTGAGPTGTPTSSVSNGAIGSASQVQEFLDQYHVLEHGALAYKYLGPTWEIHAGGTWSRGSTKNKDVQDGTFEALSTSITGLNVNINGIGQFGTGDGRASIDTASKPGVGPVDIDNGNNYSLASASSFGPLDNENTTVQANLDVRRQFDTAIPLAIKIGGNVMRTKSDVTGGAFGYAFTPPGGAAAQVVGNYDLIDPSYGATAPWAAAGGAIRHIGYISPYKVYQLYLQNPSYFVYGTPQQAAEYVSEVNTAKNLQETIPAAYIRADAKFFNSKLWLVGGVRFEQTQEYGLGPLQNVGAGFQHDSNGKNILSSTGALIPISTNPLTEDQLEYTKYGMSSSKRYEGAYPSINASYTFNPHLVARVAYAKTIGRPDISSIIPGTTVTDTATGINNITIINTGLKPWTADNYDSSLEMYDVKGATLTASAYRKDLKNFFGSTISAATPELLTSLGLDPTQTSSYQVTTMQNFGAATIEGLELSYRQSLASFNVPYWLKGLEWFGNLTTQTLSGPNQASFTTFSPHNAAWGVGYSAKQFLVKLNMQSTGWIRQGVQAQSATVPAGAYNWYAPITRVDVSGEIKLRRWLSLYGSVRNLLNAPLRQGIKGPGIAPYTVLYYYQYTGALVTVGIKGEF